MAIGSGQVSLKDIEDEYGGSAPTALSEYYGDGNAPGSGEIQIHADFQGTEDIVPLALDFFILAGGGGGGNSAAWYDPGAGAGGFIESTTAEQMGNIADIAVTVGAGGAKQTNGGNSVIAFDTRTITANGGGHGTYYAAGTAGGSGGGGGGSSVSHAGASGNQGSATGYNGYGGNGGSGGHTNGGGGAGGGAGGNGTNGVGPGHETYYSVHGGVGGAARATSFNGTSTYFGGGGGGENGWRAGNSRVHGTGGDATDGLGTGGHSGYVGNSGRVMIKYASDSAKATGGTVTNFDDGGTTMQVHTFTSSGTFSLGS
jgi:hypothetical protein